MDKQRKDIIKQIKDLSYSRKSVNIDHINLQGINFVGEDLLVQTDDQGQDYLILWDKVFYYKDIGASMPTEAIFTDIDNALAANVLCSNIVCLSGLIDNDLDLNKLTKYSTIVTPTMDVQDFLSFVGACKAVVYVNNNPYIYHNSTSLDTTSVSNIGISFRKNTDYLIEVFVYGTSSIQTSIKLNSKVFRHIKEVKLSEIPKPKNVYATKNLPDSIKISWEQNPSANLAGGGVEIWGTHGEVSSDTTFSLLDRVSYPINFYLHTSQLGSENIIPNGDLQDVIYSDGSTFADVGVGGWNSFSVEDSTGVMDWGVSFPDSSYAVTTATSSIDGYSNYLVFSRRYSRSVDLDHVVEYNIPYVSEVNNLYTDDFINMNYSSDYFVHLDTSTTRLDGTDGWLTFYWEHNETPLDASVYCMVFKDGVLDYSTGVPLSDKTFAYKLEANDYGHLKADTTWLSARFGVNPGHAQAAPVGTLASLYNVQIQSLFDFELPPVVSFVSNKFSVSYSTDYVFDMLYKNLGGVASVSIDVSYYDQNFLYLGKGNVVTSEADRNTSGSWVSLRKEVSIPYWYREARFASISVNISNSVTEELRFAIQRVHLIKTTTRTLPPDDKFTYKLRNYNSELSYSSYTESVEGATSKEIYYLSLEKSRDYVSHFLSQNIFARTTTPISQIDLYVNSFDGKYIIPLQEVSSSSSNTDFTFKYVPILSNAVVYDTFDYDYRLASNGSPFMAVTNFQETAEESPARSRAVCFNPTGSSEFAIYHFDSFWSYGGYTDIDNFRTYLNFGSSNNLKFKTYYINGVSDFYKGLFGNTKLNSNVHHKDPENKKKISIGLILKTGGQLLVSELISRQPEVYSLYVGDSSVAGYNQIRVNLRGSDFGGSNNGDVELYHNIPVNKWVYLHISADTDNLYDINRTYISAFDIENYPDHTVANYEANPLVVNTSPSSWYWDNVQTVNNGIISPTGSSIQLQMDTYYLTADIIDKAVIDDVVSNLIAESRNPHFPSFGYATGDLMTVSAEAIPTAVLEYDQANTEIPYNADMLLAETGQYVDWSEPDGTCYILREAFTLNQNTLENIDDLQNTYTYSLINKILVDFTNDYSDIYKVRFSNDRTSWSSWRNFNEAIVYPWELKELGDCSWDSTEGGAREVFTQVITYTGNTSDYWLKSNHRDSIYYNPLASVGSIESFNYSPGTQGWAINLDGSAEFSEVLIRDSAINFGKNINLLKLSESAMNGQVPNSTGGRYNSVVPANGSDLVTDFNTIPLYTSYSPPDDDAIVQNNSSVCVDLYDKDYIYKSWVSLASPNNQVYMVRHKMTKEGAPYNLATIELLGNVNNTLDSFANAHICLTKDYVYAGYGNSIKRFSKRDFTNVSGSNVPDTSITTGSITCIQGLKSGYDINGNARIVVYHVAKNSAIIRFNTYDENLNLLATAYHNLGTTANIPYYVSNSFDYNGRYIVFSDFNGTFYQVDVKSSPVSGAIPTTRSVDINSLVNTYRSHEDLGEYVAVDLEFRYPTGVRLFDEIFCVFTEPGNHPLANNNSRTVYNIFAMCDLFDAYDSISTKSGVTSLMWLSNTSVPSIYSNVSYGFYAKYPELTAAQIATTPFSTLTEEFTENQVLGYPFYSHITLFGATPQTDSDEIALGFTPPTLVRDNIITSYTHSNVFLYGYTEYKFAFDNRSISIPPIKMTGRKDFKSSGHFYNGNLLYWFGLGGTEYNSVYFSRRLQ